MKVRYIGDYYKVSLIKGKIYEVISQHNGWYEIFDETEEEYLFPNNMFEIVEE